MSNLEKCFEIRAERLELQRKVDVLEQAEKDLLYDIQKEMSKNKVTRYQSGTYLATVEDKDVPKATDWPAVLNYIRETGATDLLQKRLTESAVKARWDSGVDVPGISKSVKSTVTIEKVTS